LAYVLLGTNESIWKGDGIGLIRDGTEVMRTRRGTRYGWRKNSVKERINVRDGIGSPPL
jgi:hypothetical protein